MFCLISFGLDPTPAEGSVLATLCSNHGAKIKKFIL